MKLQKVRNVRTLTLVAMIFLFIGCQSGSSPSQVTGENAPDSVQSDLLQALINPQAFLPLGFKPSALQAGVPGSFSVFVPGVDLVGEKAVFVTIKVNQLAGQDPWTYLTEHPEQFAFVHVDSLKPANDPSLSAEAGAYFNTPQGPNELMVAAAVIVETTQTLYVTPSFTPVKIGAASLSAETCSSAERAGITWVFDKLVPCGQFVTGDWWVVGPVTVSMITISGANVEQPKCGSGARSGSQINPRFSNVAGYDSRGGSAFDASLCKAPPIALQPGDTLVTESSYASIPPGLPGVPSVTKNAAVLTVVDLPQSDDKFRPPYTRPTRYPQSAQDPLSFSTNQVQWNLLKNLQPVASTPLLENSLAKVEKPWIDHFHPWTGYHFMPNENMPNYGREWAQRTGEAMLQTMLNYPLAVKKPAAIALIQMGIDLYGALSDGGEWLSDAGIFQGRKAPIIYAGMLLNHPGMKSIATTHDYMLVNGHKKFFFSEDGQTYSYDDPDLPNYVQSYTGYPCTPGATADCYTVFGAKGWVDQYNGNPGSTTNWRIREGLNFGTYELHEHLPVSSWTPASGPSQWVTHEKSEDYRRCCTSVSFVGVALAMRLLGAVETWGHQPFFDYVDRWMTENDEKQIIAIIDKFKAGYQVASANAMLISGTKYNLFSSSGWASASVGSWVAWDYPSSQNSRLGTVQSVSGNTLVVTFENALNPAALNNRPVKGTTYWWAARQQSAVDGAAGGSPFIHNMWMAYR